MNNLSLDGKVILVTGGGRGLGLAMARGLASAGADVVAATHIQGDVDALERFDVGSGSAGSIRPILADLRDPAQCQAVVGETIAQFGAIHGLINNAGIAPGLIAPDHVDPDQPRPKFWETGDDMVQAVIATNYVAANRMARPHFSYSPWPARRGPADRAGKPRGAMLRIGQAA